MTETDDRIIVSKQALEMALELAKKCDDDTLDYLREIIDTGEAVEPKECAWTWDSREWWHTSCAGTFGYAHRKPHGFTYCPHCGGRIVDPIPKRLCWCGTEMREISVPGGGWRVTCSEGYTAHGTGPVAPTESEAWAAYDKMMRGGEG